MARIVVSALASVLVMCALPSASGEEAVATVRVDAAVSLGPSNQELVGVGWNTGPLDGVAPLAPRQVRIDGNLQTLSVGPGQLDVAALEALLDRVATVRSSGAEPLVILSYMPPWLARHFGGFDARDPTRVRPSDYGAWQALVEDVVMRLASAPAPAYSFEVWNEPDVPIFWQDLPDAFIELATRTHRAVDAVAASTGLPLEVGGPAVAFPDPAFIVPYVLRMAREGLPLDFVSWHSYGNSPLLGPDGAESILPGEVMPVYPVLGRRNPVTNPSAYREQVRFVRGIVGAALAGSALAPELVIDEWNVSAGGYDLRHDTNEGAAFTAAVLMQMEEAGLDGADFYRASDDPANDGRRGDWGLVDADGGAKPAWWVFAAWQATAGQRLRTSVLPTVSQTIFARATRAGEELHLLLASFDANGGSDRSAEVELAGASCGSEAELRVIDDPEDDLAGGQTVPVANDRVSLSLPAQSVVWLTLGGCAETAITTRG